MTDTVLTAVFALGGSAATSYLLTPVVARVARKRGVLDAPGGRHLHEGEVPRLGGVSLFLGFLVGALVYGMAFGWDRLARVVTGESFLVLLVPCGFVFLVGVVDDVRGLGPAPRVVAELLAAGVLIHAGYVIDVVANPFGLPVDTGFLAIPLTLLWFVGVTNSFNLTDGIDGLMVVLGMAALAGAAAVGFLQGQIGTGVLALALCGALGGFLRWNWHPARIFLGDSGSLLVGFTVAAISLKVARNQGGVLNFHIPLALSAIPITETFLTLARRYVSGQAYFSGDQSHIHHMLVKSGMPVRRAVGALGILAALFAAVGALSLSWRDVGTGVTIAILLAAIALGLRRLHYVEIRILVDRVRYSLFRPRRRGLTHLAALARAGDRVRGASTARELGASLLEAAVQGGFTLLALDLAETARGALPDPAPDLPEGIPEAAALAASRRAGALWVVAPRRETPPDPTCPSVTLEFPLPLEDGSLGRLICLRTLAPGSSGAPVQDVRRYLAEPVSEALAAVLATAPRSDPPGSRSAPSLEPLATGDRAPEVP